MAREKGKKLHDGGDRRPLSAQRRAEVAAQVRTLAEPLCAAEGLELVHVEYQRESGGRILRLYIDRPGGTRLDDCVAVSRQLNDILDVYLEHDLSYSLEVSSPGPDRPLGMPEDFDRFKGHKAVLRTVEPIDGRKNFKGTLMGLTGDRVGLQMADRAVAIPLRQLQKARLVNYHGES